MTPSDKMELVEIQNYINIWGSQADRSHCLSMINPLVEKHPNNAHVRYVQAKVLGEIGETDDAITAIQEAKKLGRCWEILLTEAKLYFNRCYYTQAIEIFSSAIACGGMSPKEKSKIEEYIDLAKKHLHEAQP